MGATSQTAEASEAHFCVLPLRNGALGTARSKKGPGAKELRSFFLPLFIGVRGRGILGSLDT
jgi:hypothetical protein